MPEPLESSVIRILRSSGEIAGTGFLVTSDLVVTCAHVIEAVGAKPGDSISICFHRASQPQTARVQACIQTDDVAFLEIETTERKPIRLGYATTSNGKDFQAFGYPEGGTVQERWPTGRVGGLVHVKGYEHDLLQLDGETIDRGLSGGPVWDVATGLVVGMVTGFEDLDPQRGTQGRNRTAPPVRLGYAITAETLRLLYPELIGSDVCPYRSLDSFTEADAEFFFGRERVVERLLASLRRQPRFLAVLGPSGSGKSSVVQAGLIPALRKGEFKDSDQWEFILTRPADQPFKQLEIAGLKNSEQGLVSTIKNIKGTRLYASRIVMVIDQFEELLVPFATIQRQFVDQLVELLVCDQPITIIITLRGEFLNRLLEKAPKIAEWLDGNTVNIAPVIERDEINAMIEMPAIRAGLRLEEGLLLAILSDALMINGVTQESAPNTILPLLEFTLHQLWRKRENGFLTNATYQSIGGVTGGLSQWADNTYYSLNQQQRTIAQLVLTSLVNPGDESQSIPDTRRIRRLVDLTHREEDLKVISHLATARLITTARALGQSHDTVELIHDVLLHEWNGLRNWLQEDRSFLIWHAKLDGRVKAWVTAEKKDKGRLLTGQDLKDAQSWLVNRKNDLLAVERAYILASLNEKKLQNVRVRLFGSAFLTSILLMLCALCAVIVAGLVLFDRTPAKVSFDNQVIEIRNRFNYRFFRKDVGSKISTYGGPEKLTPGSGYTLIVGTGPDGEKPGSILAYDMFGHLIWSHEANSDPYGGPTANFTITRIIVEPILNNGQYQIIFTSQKTDWYPSELSLYKIVFETGVSDDTCASQRSLTAEEPEQFGLLAGSVLPITSSKVC